MSGMDLSNTQTFDLWLATREEHVWGDQINMLRSRTKYHVTNKWFQQDRVEVTGGTQIEWEVVRDTNGTAKMILPGEPRTYGDSDTLLKCTAPWRTLNNYYRATMAELKRNYGNGGPGQLVNLLDKKRLNCLFGMAKMLEQRAWKAPASSSDKKNFYGLPYYIVKPTAAQTTADTEGWEGANPNYEDGNDIGECAGVDASEAANSLWRNYIASWSNAAGEITEDDVDIVLRMLRKLDFEAPIVAQDVYQGRFDNFAVYAGDTIVTNADRKARANNDSLGSDLGRFAGQARFRGTPIIWIEDLDSDTSYPLYAVNHDLFHPFLLSGENFTEDGPMRGPTHPDVLITNVDLTAQYACRDRRGCGCIAYST